MADQKPLTLLEQLVKRHGGYEKVAEALTRLAQERDIDATMSSKHLERLARRRSRHQDCRSGTRAMLEAMFGWPFEDLFRPPEQLGENSSGVVTAPEFSDPRGLAAAAARDSLDFATWAQADSVSPAVLEHINDELQRIAVAYVHAPLLPLFRDLVELRDLSTNLLRTRPHPRHSRELFTATATTCLLLAHASQNLGDSQAAAAQARAAWICAEQADHNDLRAWILGTQALIAEWSGRQGKAVDSCRRGLEYATSPESRVRLHAIAARALGRQGDDNGAIEHVVAAQRARDGGGRDDALAEYGGLLTFPHVKQLYYAGSTLTLAGEPEAAEQTALEAIQLYETARPEERSYGDEALARVDVALARLATDDLDGVREALQPVLALPSGQRIKQIGNGLQRVRAQLTTTRYQRVSLAGDLRDEIDGFAGSPAERPLLS